MNGIGVTGLVVLVPVKILLARFASLVDVASVVGMVFLFYVFGRVINVRVAVELPFLQFRLRI